MALSPFSSRRQNASGFGAPGSRQAIQITAIGLSPPNRDSGKIEIPEVTMASYRQTGKRFLERHRVNIKPYRQERCRVPLLPRV